MDTQISRAVAVLLLARANALLITSALGIQKGMTNNPLFPNPTPTMATFGQTVTTFQQAETAVLTRAKGAAQARDAAKKPLIVQMQELRAYVQSLADANPAQAETIIHAAGMSVRKRITRGPRVFAVKAAANSGSVKLTAPTSGPRAAYSWEYSVDGGKTWVEAPDTTRSETTVAGLPPATSVQFRYRAVTPRGQSDWSQPLVHLVT